MSEEMAKSEDMWTPFKELQTIVEAVVSRPVQGVLKQVEGVLRKHKQNFITLLKNPPKNAKSREELRKGITEGISLPGLGHQILSKELVDEAIIISDMYDLNEYMALDLLCTAQQQMPYHPGLTRGLVAVLLYYDGRKSIATTLRALVQARKGISWTLDSSEEVVSYITQYTQELMEYGLINKILDLLQTLDLSKEIELLQQNRALGGPRHHRQVEDLFTGIRQTLADVVYFWAAQCGLPKDPTFKLINYLKSTTLNEDATGAIDGVTLALIMALLYALDLSILQRREDGEQLVLKLPLISEPDFIKNLIRELSPSGKGWQSIGLQALANLAWGLALATLHMAPSNLHPPEGFIDEDDLLVDSAIDMKVFDFLHHVVLQNDTIYKEEFYVRRLHCLITDFIVLMPLKLKDLRNRADETARTMQVYTHEGLEPPSHLPRHYEHLLVTIAKLYRKTSASEQLNLDLVLDYWTSVDFIPSATSASTSFHFRSSSRQTSLSKFVSGCADLLPPLLFVPYMKMLCSLASHPQAARHAFNLLKHNVLGNSVNVSWDHFFQSLNRYYSNLRQELPPTTDTVYRHRNYPRGITPQEIQGLQAVLAVVRAVAENDEMARVALCDNPAWAPLTVLLGLVSCSVPIPLKAELLLTLAALARSPDTAATLWHNLEASQILTTVPSTSSYQPRGIQTELEEIESRNEEFPLTRALLQLLDVLTDVSVPRLLGVGNRTPGFDPYLNFVINSVFLRFNNRSYKNPDEKWAVAKSCLKLMVKFLVQYEPRVEDFTGNRIELQGGGVAQVNPHPGYHIMVHLNTKSELLRLVLFLLDEGCHLLDTYSTFPGKESLEDSMLSCLDLLDRALAHQHKFFTYLSKSGCSLLLAGLNKLLLGVNPRSGKPDHLLNIAKYVTYNAWLPRHALAAVKTLLSVTTFPASHGQIISAFTSSPVNKMEIRHGFVECLEADDEEIIMGEDGEGEDMGVVGKTKEAILKLLQQCLGHPPPNLAHYLFGFDINKDIRKSAFQQAGVMGFPRTCLHSLLTILDSSVTARTVPFASVPKPHLLDSAYCMLYFLCANGRTSEPVLRFLRSCNDFLARHLGCMPFSNNSHQPAELNQMAWLLKTIAIELKVTATHMHHSQLGNLVNLLVREQGEEMVAVSVEENAPSEITEVATIMQLSHYLATPSTFASSARNRDPLILRLLLFLDFSLEGVHPPVWEFFEPSQIEQVLMQCEVGSSSARLKLIDVKKLHRILMEELAAIQGSSTAGQRQLILQEIQGVLMYAVKHNLHRSRMGSTVRYMDSWRQVTEVLFAVTPPEILPFELRKQLLLETVRLLLRKVLLQDTVPELGSLTSGVVLLLLVNLRHCLLVKQKEVKFGPTKDRLGSSNTGVSDGTDTFHTPSLQANTATLKVILSNIVEWLLKSGISSQQLRANLYGALLNLLHIACIGGALVPEVPGEDVNDSAYMSHLDSSRYRERSQCQASLEAIVGFGEGLVDILCHDCIGGHDVCKMLALSCLDKLIELDPHTNWVSFLSSRGYLKHLIDDLLDSDTKLIALLDGTPTTLRPLYLYESQMAMLCRIASTHSGAELLLEQGTFSSLSSMVAFDRHPDIAKQESVTAEIEFVPSVGDRYMQILFPALDLCDAILTSLGTDNQSCTVQILHFLLNHIEMVTMVLRAGSPYMQLRHLKELARLTGVIARSAFQEMCHVNAADPKAEISSQIRRIQNLMLALLPRFVVSESILRELTGSANITSTRPPTIGGPGSRQTEFTGGEDKMEAVQRFFQVACHLVLYARNIVASHGVDHRASSVIFKPSLAESLSSERRPRESHNMGESTVPNLGVVVQQLVRCVEHHHREKAALDLLTRKLTSVCNMNSTELKEFLPEGSMSSGSVSENRFLAAQHLNVRVKLKRQELVYCSFVVENCLYLVWCHLDYYMLRYLPKGAPNNMSSPFMKNADNTTISKATWNASVEELSQLKQGLLGIFNDSFSRKLIDTKQDQPAADKGFVEALLRRIKRLVQFVPIK